MDQIKQRQFDSLIRSEDFLQQNPNVLGLTSEAAKLIEDAIAQLRQHITAQGATQLVVEGQTGRIQGMAKTLVKTHLVPIAKFARASLKGVPEYATLITTVRARSPKKVVDHAFAVAKAGAQYINAMVAVGFPADTFDHLVAATTELNDAIVKREPLSKDRVQSTNTIASIIALGRKGVRQADSALEKLLAPDSPALAAWKAASRVKAKAGGIRKPVSAKSVTEDPAATVTADAPKAVTK